MEVILKIAALGFMGLLMLQDWRSRHISSMVLGFLALVLFVLGIHQQSFTLWGIDVLASLLFMLLLFSISFLSLRITKGKAFKVHDYLGLGDLLFLVALSLYFSFSWMWLILLGGTLFTLLFWLAYTRFNKKQASIPFITTLGAFVLCIEISSLFTSLPTASDSWWLLDLLAA